MKNVGLMSKQRNYLFFKKLIYFCLCWVFVAAHRLSLVVVSWLLTAGASFVAEHGLQGMWASVVAAHGLQGAALVVAHGLGCPTAFGISPDQRLNGVPYITRWILNYWATWGRRHCCSFLALWCSFCFVMVLERFCHLTCSGACEIYQRAGSALRK